MQWRERGDVICFMFASNVLYEGHPPRYFGDIACESNVERRNLMVMYYVHINIVSIEGI